MRHLRITSQFNRDFKLAIKRGKNIEKFKAVRDRLMRSELLEPKYRDHPLRGRWEDCRDCHIEPDWLLIYKVEYSDPETLILVRLGSHADLFR